MFRFDTAMTDYAGFNDSSNFEWKRLITYAPGNWSYSNSAYDNNYFHIWVHDTGSSEKIYIGGCKKQYSNENSNSSAGNLPHDEQHFLGKWGNDDDQADWCSNLSGGAEGTYGYYNMDSDTAISEDNMG